MRGDFAQALDERVSEALAVLDDVSGPGEDGPSAPEDVLVLTRQCLKVLGGLPREVTSATDLARWNSARDLASMTNAALKSAGGGRLEELKRAFLEVGIALTIGSSEVLERGSLSALLLEQLWVRNFPGKGEQRLTLEAAVCPLVVAAEPWAQAAVSGAHVVVLKDPGASGSRMVRACEVSRFSRVLLVPVGALGLLDTKVQEVLLVGDVTPGLLERLETLEVLAGTRSSVDLAELFEAAGEL
jgi:hypothetical protein